MRYFLKLGYCGAAFHGWQRQPNAGSVQQTLEEALSTLLRRPVEITGAGRTDTGVNARVMYAHFDTEEPVADKERFLRSLNRLCGRDIAVGDLIEVADDAHARFDATSRTYKYFVAFRKDPFLWRYSWQSRPLDIEAMNEAAKLLLETSDFTSFAKLHSDNKTNICRVTEARWKPIEGMIGDSRENGIISGNRNDDIVGGSRKNGIIGAGDSETGCAGAVFTITADRFLRNMVRAVVGTLVDVGRGKMDTHGFAAVIAGRSRSLAGTSMPGEALFLWNVTYPYLP